MMYAFTFAVFIKSTTLRTYKNVPRMYVIFLIWQCPDIQELAIHAFPNIYLNLNVKMSDFEVKTKMFWRCFKYTRQDICRFNNAA